jgi:hypothetical protein
MSGDDRRDATLADLESRRARYVLRARRAFALALLQKGEATADDVYSAVHLPVGVDPRCLGCVPKPLARSGIVRAAGFVKSERPERNSSYIHRWELVDRERAIRWLFDHPDVPETDANEKARQLPLPGVA